MDVSSHSRGAFPLASTLNWSGYHQASSSPCPSKSPNPRLDEWVSQPAARHQGVALTRLPAYSGRREHFRPPIRRPSLAGMVRSPSKAAGLHRICSKLELTETAGHGPPGTVSPACSGSHQALASTWPLTTTATATHLLRPLPRLPERAPQDRLRSYRHRPASLPLRLPPSPRRRLLLLTRSD